METTIVHWGYEGVMEKKTGTTLVYLAYIGIMEKMETTICEATPSVCLQGRPKVHIAALSLSLTRREAVAILRSSLGQSLLPATVTTRNTMSYNGPVIKPL